MTPEKEIEELKKELIESKVRRNQLSAKTDGLSLKSRNRHKQEIVQLKRSLNTAQEAVDSEEFYRIKNIGLKEENRQLKQDKIKLERRIKFIHKEYERILNVNIQSTKSKSSDKQGNEKSEYDRSRDRGINPGFITSWDENH